MIQRVSNGNSKAQATSDDGQRHVFIFNLMPRKKENDALAGAVYRLNFLQANIWHRLGYSNAPPPPTPPSTAEKILFFVVVKAGSQAALTARRNVSPPFVLFQNCSLRQLCLLKKIKDSYSLLFRSFTSIKILQKLFSILILSSQDADVCRRQHMFQIPCQLYSLSK